MFGPTSIRGDAGCRTGGCATTVAAERATMTAQATGIVEPARAVAGMGIRDDLVESEGHRDIHDDGDCLVVLCARLELPLLQRFDALSIHSVFVFVERSGDRDVANGPVLEHHRIHSHGAL